MLHEHVVIVSIVNENVPHIRHADRVTISDLGYEDDGIVHVRCRVGFNDSQDIPKALALAAGHSPELNVDPGLAQYYRSVFELEPRGERTVRTWREQLFLALAHRAADRSRVFHLPPDRTVVMGARSAL